jgi:hypothetical protein
VVENTRNINNNFKINNKPLDYLQQAFNHPFPSIKYYAVTSSEISKIIKSLLTKGSYGYDKISVKILKFSIYHFSINLY